ncbi:MAG: hypothetical protein OXN21_09900 [Chloroflexota bacterium]|nr:hypothetical protein [Chloroflexota bacterium]
MEFKDPYNRAIRIPCLECRLKLPAQWQRRCMAGWRAVGFFAANTLTLAGHRGKNNCCGFPTGMMPETSANLASDLYQRNLPSAGFLRLKHPGSGAN